MKLKTVILILALSGLLQAQETLQPYHWAHSYIDYFIVRGDLGALNKMERPFSRMQITKAILKLHDSEGLTQKERQMVEVLLREFEFEGRQIKEKTKDKGLLNLVNKAMKFLGKGKSQAAFKAGVYGQFSSNSFSAADSSFSNLQLNPNVTMAWQDLLTLHVNIRMFNKAPANYLGKKFAGIYAFTEQSYISLNHEWFGLKVGRDYLQHGPGHTGQLLFSDNSRTFDMYHVRLGSSKLNFTFWGMALDAINAGSDAQNAVTSKANRYINGHRLSFNIADRYRFALSEVVLYGGVGQGWDLGMMNPLMFYYGYNLNNTGFDANTFYSLEWDLYFNDHIELYGEFIIDDIQVEKKKPSDLEPNELGLLTGFKWSKPFNLPASKFTLEYVQVRNRTYNVENNPWEKYLHRNEVIGYELGNNLERFYMAFDFWPLANLQLGVNAGLIRQGEGTVQGPFNTDYKNHTVEEGYDEAFPFGTVESNVHTGFSLFYKPVKFGHLSADISYNRFENFKHIKNKDENDLQVRLKLWLQWDYFLNNL